MWCCLSLCSLRQSSKMSFSAGFAARLKAVQRELWRHCTALFASSQEASVAIPGPVPGFARISLVPIRLSINRRATPSDSSKARPLFNSMTGRFTSLASEGSQAAIDVVLELQMPFGLPRCSSGCPAHVHSRGICKGCRVTGYCLPSTGDVRRCAHLRMHSFLSGRRMVRADHLMLTWHEE